MPLHQQPKKPSESASKVGARLSESPAVIPLLTSVSPVDHHQVISYCPFFLVGYLSGYFRQVGGGDDGFHSRERQRPARVDTPDTGMGVGTTQNFAVQHPGGNRRRNGPCPLLCRVHHAESDEYPRPGIPRLIKPCLVGTRASFSPLFACRFHLKDPRLFIVGSS